MDTEHHILCLGARTHLDPGAERELRERLAGPVAWDHLWDQANLHEVTPLVASTLGRVPEPAGVPSEWLARADRRARATLFRNLVLADELLSVLRTLADGGLTPVPVKGLVLAETVYGDLSLRPAGDIDVLVRPSQRGPARELLAGIGYRQSAAPSFESLHHPFHDVEYFRETGEGVVCLEIHSALWNPGFHRPDVGLWDRLVPGELRGVAVRLLSPEDVLLHLAIHRARSPLRLRFVCDVAEAVRRYGDGLDWVGLVRRAELLEARTALSTVLRLSRDLLGAPVPADSMERLRVGALKRRLLDRTCGARALFRPVAADDLTQQPSLALRALELDGLVRIGTTLAGGVGRKLEKRRYERALARGASASARALV
jgi:hypothetical protein